jgi:amino acid transporter
MDTLSHRKNSGENATERDTDQKPAEEAMPGELISAGSQHLHRKLGGKEIQLSAVPSELVCLITIALSTDMC